MAKHDFPRHTGRAIVIKDGHILLIERWLDGMHYFSIPGGGIEAGENAETTAKREVKEETNIEIEIERPLYIMTDGDADHTVFLGRYINGEPYLPPDSEEATGGGNNRYKPQWVPIEAVQSLTLGYWQPLHKTLVEDLKNGFSKSVKITAA